MAYFERRASFETSERLTQTLSTSSQQNRSRAFNERDGVWETPLPAEISPVSAFEVSKPRRLLQILTAVIYCLLAAGVVFGFAALKPILIREGVYQDRCTKEELEEGVYVCYGQEVRLNLMFTTAAVSTNVCALPVGAILDRFGPRIASLIGCLFLTLGAILLAFAVDIPFDTYILGYLLLALGGPFVFIPSFHLSNAFPKHSGLVLALLTGAFDTSSAMFLAFRLIYQDSDYSFKPKYFFLLYLIVPAFILLAQIIIMPGKSYKTINELVQQREEQEAAITEDTPLLRDDTTQTPTISDGEHRQSIVSEITALLPETHPPPKSTPSLTGVLHHLPAARQITTPYWLLITAFTIVQMTRINYFITTIRTQYTHLLTPPLATHLNQIFDMLLPLGGVLSIPFIGLILDNLPIPLVLVLLVTTATTIGILGAVGNLYAAYANIALFVLYRPFYYTAISDYAAKVFGFETFGKVYGLIICLAGLGNFSQAGLDALTHEVFGDDPVPVNVGLCVLAGVIGVGLVGYVWRQTVVVKRREG